MPAPSNQTRDNHPPENPLAELAVRQAEQRVQRGKRRRPSPVPLLRRIQHIHEVHRRRALQAGVALDYAVEDLRRFVLRRLAAGACPCCRQSLTPRTFAVTHKNPPRRGGRHALTNVLVCCRTCRAVKGPLDGQEFQELLLLMRAWPEPVRRLFVNRFRRAFRSRPGPRAA